MKVSLITGASGFAGGHLTRLLLHNNHDVFATYQNDVDKSTVDSDLSEAKWKELNLFDKVSLIKLLKESKPDCIFHLSGQSNVPLSWEYPIETYNVNFFGTMNLLDAIIESGIDPKILVICSGDEYGNVPVTRQPIKEEEPLKPINPYAVSKVCQDMVAYQYFISKNLKIIRVRPFPHIGMGQRPIFATPNFARQIALIESGKMEPVIKVGNLKAVRDYTDVRDIAKAYLLAIEKCDIGEVYNISSSRGVVINDVLDKLISMSKKDVKIQIDQTLLRPVDIPYLVGDCSKFKNKTGWTPQIKLEETLQDLLDFWRFKVSS